jgi:hypothetical protein
MREPRLAIHPLLDGAPAAGEHERWPWSRTALVASALAHLLAAYALSRMSWPDPEPVRAPAAEFVFLSPVPPAPPRVEPVVRPAEPVVPPAVVVPPPELEVTEPRAPEPEPQPAPRAAEAPAPSVPRAVLVPPTPRESEPPSVPAPAPPTRAELDEARQRAAAEVVDQLAADREYLSFSMDDVAPPREARPEPKPSIFDGTGASRRNSTTVGQQRTRVGRAVAELCNALTGGFSIMGMGSFCSRGDDEPSGLFPEVRPEILDLMPECVETRPLSEALGEESPFPTVKCRLVPKVEVDSIPR